MPAELQPAPPAAPRPTLDAPALEALRRLGLQCAQQAELADVVAVLRRGAVWLDGADALEVAYGAAAPADSPLAALAQQVQRGGRASPLEAGSANGLRRAVAVPMRVHGEPAALALGWSAGDPGAERAEALAGALAEQAAAALGSVARHTELRDAAFRRDRFFSAMSHDLRTPITAIVGYSELLQDGIVGPLGDRQQEMVERICQVSGELSQLVTDMLDLAKLDAGRMEFHREPETLDALVDSAVEAAEPQLEATGATVQRGPPAGPEATLFVDRPRVRQVVANLIAHAAQAAPGGVIAVSAVADAAEVRVEVSDGGPPLPPGAEESLFEALPQQGATRTGRVGPGAALSLALSRRIARCMGGELDARSGAGGVGVLLTLRLPQGPG